MTTELLQFDNFKKQTLRGVCTFADEKVNHGLICVGGFERSGTTEKKFKVISDEMRHKGQAAFRYDATGLGLSDGSFEDITVKRMTRDLKDAIQAFKERIEIENLSVIAHSVSGCVIASLLQEEPKIFNKIILLAPALNQKELLRFYFVTKKMKVRHDKLKVKWSNYRDYLDEKAFQDDCQRLDKMTRANRISDKYFRENKDLDYAPLLKPFQEKILHIHGARDIKVPLESYDFDFHNRLIIDGADHDLERPDWMRQWMDEAVKFVMS